MISPKGFSNDPQRQITKKVETEATYLLKTQIIPLTGHLNELFPQGLEIPLTLSLVIAI